MASTRTWNLLGVAAWHTILLIVCGVIVIPIVFLILNSFKSLPELAQSPYGLPRSFASANYTRAWQEARIAVTLPNSILITIVSVLLNTLMASLAAYGIARFTFRWRMAVRMLFLAGLAVPIPLILLPFFVEMRILGLLGTVWALILAYSVFQIPLSLLVLVGFFGTLPREVEEAARIDGAGHARVYWNIVLPLMRPALAAIVILNGVAIWNDFFVALILSITPASRTLPVGIMAFYSGNATEWGLIFASVTISTTPVVLAYVALSRQFIAGLTAGAVKG